jgi:hypothetical protein
MVAVGVDKLKHFEEMTGRIFLENRKQAYQLIDTCSLSFLNWWIKALQHHNLDNKRCDFTLPSLFKTDNKTTSLNQPAYLK